MMNDRYTRALVDLERLFLNSPSAYFVSTIVVYIVALAPQYTVVYLEELLV
jgi:hypothetical protein